MRSSKMSEGNKKSNDHAELREENAERETGEIEPSGEKQKEKPGKPVIVSAEAYKTIILYASRYSNRSIPPENWKEIYGVLIGFSEDDFVHVIGAEALTFGHETDVILDNRHYVFIAEIQDKLVAQGNKLYIVGWFHSHPGLGLFFSDIDLRNQIFFQTHEDGIGLVFDHTLLGKKKQEKSEESEFIITKYDTGFEIYRITDTNMDVNTPEYSNNYHKVDYIVDGLNKYFFANVLSELSALVSEGKPLQSAYGEKEQEEDNISTKPEVTERFSPFDSDVGITSNNDFLTEIPMEEEIDFKVDDFSQKEQQRQKDRKKKELAEQSIYEGNQAFNNKDAFAGIEKFRQGINHYRDLKSFDKVMDLLRTVSQKCIANDHLIFAGEFAEELLKLSKKHKNLFYRGVSNYILGYILLKKGENDVLEEGLNKVQDAAVDFEKEGDYAGAGMCFNKIGNIYQSRLNILENACLFYRAAIENYNNAILKMHPLRTSFWNKPELLIQKIIELRDIVEELLPNLINIEIKNRIIKDLRNLHYNF
jgi:proteasome lid subunit RPN8/RPN11